MRRCAGDHARWSAGSARREAQRGLKLQGRDALGGDDDQECHRVAGRGERPFGRV
jgi:hypothetical protein